MVKNSKGSISKTLDICLKKEDYTKV